jgi:hypothetical protein
LTSLARLALPGTICMMADEGIGLEKFAHVLPVVLR